jgi:hypothetical protein
MLVSELPGGKVGLYCKVGCDPAGLRRVLVPDLEAEGLAHAYSAVLLWAQNYRKEGRHERTATERRAA